MKDTRIAFLYSGQGAQYVGMGKTFKETFSTYRECFEEAEEILKENYLDLSLEGPETQLILTRKCQLAIYLMSTALTRVLKEQFPTIQPTYTAGLSLGEYSALTAASILDFPSGVQLVKCRAEAMHKACEETKGTMAVIIGMTSQEVEQLVKEAQLPNDLWAANFNSPGQIVISGTEKGVAYGTSLAKERGAKRVIPLTVHGAFHSGLMRSAAPLLAQGLSQVTLQKGVTPLIMNVTGQEENNADIIKENLLKQLTYPVRWEQGIQTIEAQGVDLYVEIGPGTVLKGLNKRIGVKAPTLNIDAVKDLDILAEHLELTLKTT